MGKEQDAKQLRDENFYPLLGCSEIAAAGRSEGTGEVGIASACGIRLPLGSSAEASFHAWRFERETRQDCGESGRAIAEYKEYKKTRVASHHPAC